MQLSVKPYYQYRPASQWAFDVEFSDILLLNAAGELVKTGTFTQEDLNRISQAVVSVTQPKYKIEADTKCYGNFDFTVPKYDTNDLQLTVTFEETDDLLISHKFIGSLMGNVKNSDSPAWLNVHPRIFIGISRYNTYLHDIERQSFVQYGSSNSINGRQIFCCQMSAYTEPSYERTSESPSAATCTITFLLTPQNIVHNQNNYVDDIVTPSKITTKNTLKELNEAIKEIPFVAEELLLAGSVYVRGTVLGNVDLATLRRSDSRGRAATYLNQNITDDMIKQAFSQSVFRSHSAAVVVSTMHQYFGKYGLDSTKQQQYRSNLMALAWSINNVNQTLKSQGIELRISSVNTGDHAENLSQKSHTYGSKVDLAVFANGQRVSMSNWSNNPELRANVAKALNASGLHFQAETNSPTYGAETLWLDAFLWYGYNRNGQYVESYTPGGATRWGLNNDHFEASKSQHMGWAK